MTVVSNTSPILNLFVVGRLDLLRTLYQRILIPEQVAQELARYQVPSAGWIEIANHSAEALYSELHKQLHAGEADAIAMAVDLGADLLLMDERRGRKEASKRGIEYMGLLGILAEAKALQHIPNCRSVLHDLREIAGFWLGEELNQRFLNSVGEG